MKRILIVFISAIICFVYAFGLVGCGGNGDSTNTHQHIYSDELKYDETYHWFPCTVSGCDAAKNKETHTWNSGVEKESPTCTEKGTMIYTCTVCKATKTEEIEPKGHTFSDEWSSDGTYHWHAATCEHKDEVSDKSKHDIKNGICTICNMVCELEYALSLDETYYLVTGIGTYADNIVIPSEYQNKPVKAIADSAFEGCDSLTNITISNSITVIGESAFKDCVSLKNISIPENVTSIGKSAFSGCSSLESITLPFVGANETDINDGHFGYIFGATVSSDNANCVPESLKTVDVTGGKGIVESAFSGCAFIKNITLSNTVMSIGKSAFSGCDSLESITLPFVGASETDTSNAHFGYIFGATVSSDNANFVPESLTTVDVTGGKDIVESAFSGCAFIQNITISNTVMSIGKSAFSGCDSLESITLPFVGASETDTKNTHFGYIFGASSYRYNSDYVPESLMLVTITDGDSVKDRSFYGCSSLTSVMIPDGVTSIGSYAFWGCTSLTGIVLPSGVTSIGSYAFRSCTSLTGIVLPSGVTSIGDMAFEDCESLASINIPDVVESIGERAFYNCNALTSVAVPSSVMSIGEGGFDACSSLTAINVDENNSAYCSEDGVLFDKNKSILICFPAGKSSEYSVPSGVTRIENYAFSTCRLLTDVSIPNTVTSIGKFAFGGSGLISMTIPNSVTSLGESAFIGCKSLKSVVLSNKIQMINSSTFEYCSSLTDVVIPNGVTQIRSKAFKECKSLQSITVPNSVTYIGHMTFTSCTSLKSLTIGSGVQSIDDSIISNSYNLSDIIFNGTKAQWNAVKKGDLWNFNSANYTIHCTDGVIYK